MSNTPGMNPYAVPSVVDANLAGSGSAETIRKRYLSHEASVKSIGLLYWIGGVFGALATIAYLILAVGLLTKGDPTGVITLLLAVFMGGISAFQIALARGLRHLQPWSRIGTIVLSAIGLLGFPIGTLISAYILYLVGSQKGVYVFSPEYKQIIAATPHLKYKTSIVVWILLGLVIAVIALAIVGASFSAIQR